MLTRLARTTASLHQGRAPYARPPDSDGQTPDADPPLDTSPPSRTGPMRPACDSDRRETIPRMPLHREQRVPPLSPP